MKPPVQTRSRESTDRILEATLQVLATEGMAGLTTARVAAVAEASNGAIFHRFGNRTGLLQRALDLFVERLERRAAEIRAERESSVGTIEEMVAAVVGGYLQIFAESGTLIRVFLLEARADPQLADRGEAAKEMFVAHLRDILEAFADGIDPDLDRCAWVIFRILFGYCTIRILFHDAAVIEPADVKHLEHAVLGVLRPRR